LWTRGWTPRIQTYPGREVPNPLFIEISKGDASIDVVLRVRQTLPTLWCWIVRAYALACIAVIIAIWIFHAAVPQYDGIPWWLFIFVNLPALGLEILPLILLIEVVNVMKGVYRKRRFVVQVALLAVAWCFC
jgi:hypothetical protein